MIEHTHTILKALHCSVGCTTRDLEGAWQAHHHTPQPGQATGIWFRQAPNTQSECTTGFMPRAGRSTLRFTLHTLLLIVAAERARHEAVYINCGRHIQRWHRLRHARATHL
ncbi:hypothetical protein TRVL_08691 [Trypanosoma vivax]|nr:hypothetical protein TRVL_08691 [Trypanosoma vivax]